MPLQNDNQTSSPNSSMHSIPSTGLDQHSSLDRNPAYFSSSNDMTNQIIHSRNPTANSELNSTLKSTLTSASTSNSTPTSASISISKNYRSSHQTGTKLPKNPKPKPKLKAGNNRRGPGRPPGSLNRSTLTRMKEEEEAIAMFRKLNPDIPLAHGSISINTESNSLPTAPINHPTESNIPLAKASTNDGYFVNNGLAYQPKTSNKIPSDYHPAAETQPGIYASDAKLAPGSHLQYQPSGLTSFLPPSRNPSISNNIIYATIPPRNSVTVTQNNIGPHGMGQPSMAIPAVANAQFLRSNPKTSTNNNYENEEPDADSTSKMMPNSSKHTPPVVYSNTEKIAHRSSISKTDYFSHSGSSEHNDQSDKGSSFTQQNSSFTSGRKPAFVSYNSSGLQYFQPAPPPPPMQYSNQQPQITAESSTYSQQPNGMASYTVNLNNNLMFTPIKSGSTSVPPMMYTPASNYLPVANQLTGPNSQYPQPSHHLSALGPTNSNSSTASSGAANGHNYQPGTFASQSVSAASNHNMPQQFQQQQPSQYGQMYPQFQQSNFSDMYGNIIRNDSIPNLSHSWSNYSMLPPGGVNPGGNGNGNGNGNMGSYPNINENAEF